MSFLQGILDSLSSILSSPNSSHDSNIPGSSNMGGVPAPSISNERVASKLKGYFDLAKEEISKAVRAEEWGLIDHAILHYNNAQRILIEASSTAVPSFITSSELEKVKSYREKISKWQGQVSERLQILSRRSGVKSTIQKTATQGQTAAVPFKASNARKSVLQKNHQRTNQMDKDASPRSSQISGGDYDAKSVETINTAIVDRSPSVRWEDIAGLEKAKQAILGFKGQTAAVPFKASNARKSVLQKNHQRTNQMDKDASPRSSQISGGDYDAKLVETINTAIVDRSPSVRWEDIAGLEKAKQALMEMVILPTKRRDLFTGLRRPARGLLLFGPPGNGKTMLAKAVASESAGTFFNVSAASLTSKWVGEAEKLVRTLFMVAISRQPSVIFIDEIDSIMSTRLANENDASRRLKSEFLIQFDGVTSNPDDIVIVIGATNKPQELDDAVLRRLVKRIYVPLPDANVRRLLLKHKLKGHAFSLPSGDLEKLVKDTEGYSGSDLQALCEEAAMMPIRELGSDILTVKPNQVRGLRYGDFKKAMSVIRPSLNKSKWEDLERWNEEFGSN